MRMLLRITGEAVRHVALSDEGLSALLTVAPLGSLEPATWSRWSRARGAVEGLALTVAQRGIFV